MSVPRTGTAWHMRPMWIALVVLLTFTVNAAPGSRAKAVRRHRVSGGNAASSSFSPSFADLTSTVDGLRRSAWADARRRHSRSTQCGASDGVFNQLAAHLQSVFAFPSEEREELPRGAYANTRTHHVATDHTEHREIAPNGFGATDGRRSSHGHVRSKGFNFTCPDCARLVTVLMNISENAYSLNFTHEALDVACTLVFAGNETIKQLCHDVVVLITDVWPTVTKLILFENFSPEDICAVLFHTCKLPCCATPYDPEQIHLSFAENNVFAQPSPANATAMRVTWVALGRAPDAQVVWSLDESSSCRNDACRDESSRAKSYSANATVDTYDHGGWLGHIYSAVMTGLAPGQAYQYKVGAPSSAIWSFAFTFHTLPLDIGSDNRPLRLITLADMDFRPDSDDTVMRIANEVSAGTVDVVLHYGDISYADSDQPHWDAFWRKVQPIAAYVPYMTTPGNHELLWNFSAYRHRLRMPTPQFDGESDALYYNLNIGTVSILMLNSETVINAPGMTNEQLQFVADALVSNNASRSSRPWVFVFQHRPLYCTDPSPAGECSFNADILRLLEEDTFQSFGVDLITAGHLHSYERTTPVYRGQVMSESYVNSPAPVYIVNGAAGNHEGQFYVAGDAPWSVAHSSDIGYGRMIAAANATAATVAISFVRSANGTVADTFEMVKN